MRKRALPLLLAAAVPLVAFAQRVHDQGFGKLVDDYFAAAFAYAPGFGTQAGFHEWDDKVDDRSRARIEKRISEMKGLLARLQKLDKAALSFDDRIDAEILESRAKGQLLDLETLRTWERNPMSYAQGPGGAVYSLMSRDFAPKHDRLRSIVARMKGLPALFAAGKANVQNPPKEFTALAIRMTKGGIGFFEKTVGPWAKDAAGSDAALLKEFDDANAKVVAAAKDFGEWLEKDLQPRSKGVYAIGEANYLAKLRYDEMVDMPLDELLAKGEANLEKDYAAFVETAKKIDATKTPKEVMASLADDHPSADALIPTVRGSLEDARKFVVEHGIVTVPSEVRPRVEETPPFNRSGSFASMNTPGAYETKATEAYYYVTPVEPEWDAKHKEEHLRLYNKSVIAMINVHEVWPGHYLQFLWSKKFPTKTRKLTFCGTNAEGWAHYTEQMMVDEGFGNGDPKIRLAQLSEALLRDCRYVVGVRLHTKGMTVEDGAKLFEEKGFQEPANAYEEARRGAYNPTYLYYTLGKLEIQKLRDDYMKAKGATLRQFHDAFVAQGAAPIPIVRKVLFKSPAESAPAK
jgi:uncharacterized protein (DUF885 family)